MTLPIDPNKPVIDKKPAVGGDRAPTQIAKQNFSVVVEGPDGQLHGHGNIIASAHADKWRPQDVTPRMRQIIWGKQ